MRKSILNYAKNHTFRLLSVGIATLSAISAVFIVPILYTQSQMTQTDLQDHVEFCLQRTATLQVRLEMVGYSA